MDKVRDPYRLAVLHDLEILDTPPELVYDDIVTLAASSTGSTSAAVNFLDGDRQWTKAAVGVESPHDSCLSTDLSFCAEVVRSDEALLRITDTTASERWHDHPLVTGPPGLRFYAGAKIVFCHQPVGVVCVYGDQPRDLTRRDERALFALARQVEVQLELRQRDRSMHERGLIDPSTGVGNRRLLLDRLETAIGERRRHRGEEVGVIVCASVDAYRERPQLVDRQLSAIADKLRHATGDFDTIARSAPDEFVVIVPGLADAEQLHGVLAQIRAALHAEQPVSGSADGPGLRLRATLARDGESAASVLRRA